ncbi:hypothetical protein [Aeribacillus pallidus]|uniref:hypothetical protein n=1 Tax=Aeribacillus pallidus TaxID=33936 RepID=UPI003D255E10
MSKPSYRLGSLFFIAFMLAILGGCQENSDTDEDIVAYISLNEDSVFKQTFDQLALGNIFDFHLKLPQADQSWVDIWVEGYKNGQKVSDHPITQLSFGKSPKEVDEGPIGFGIINPGDEGQLYFLYGPGVSANPHEIEEEFIIESGMTGWEDGVGTETVRLTSGETKILGAFRHTENSMETYDLSDPEAVERMIQEDTFVLLVKIKVEKRD